MDKKEILAIVRSSHENDAPLTCAMSELLINLGIMRLELDEKDPSIILYRIDIDDIIKNDIDPDYLYDKGWKVSDDEESIFKIIG